MGLAETVGTPKLDDGNPDCWTGAGGFQASGAGDDTNDTVAVVESGGGGIIPGDAKLPGAEEGLLLTGIDITDGPITPPLGVIGADGTVND